MKSRSQVLRMGYCWVQKLLMGRLPSGSNTKFTTSAFLIILFIHLKDTSLCLSNLSLNCEMNRKLKINKVGRNLKKFCISFCWLISVTRFGEISPLWQKFKVSIWQFFGGLIQYLAKLYTQVLWQIVSPLGKCSLLQMTKYGIKYISFWTQCSAVPTSVFLNGPTPASFYFVFSIQLIVNKHSI